MPCLRRNPTGRFQLQGARVLPVVHGPADECHSRKSDRARAAALNRALAQGQAARRQWVLTLPFSWRPRLAQDGELLGRLTQIFVDAVQAFYVRRAAQGGAMGAKTGAITAVQRTSSDLRLNPHLHTIALDGAWQEQGNELVLRALDI